MSMSPEQKAKLETYSRTPPPVQLKNDGQVRWYRIKGETEKAYTAFCVYRDLGASRSYPKVAEKLGKSVDLIKRWGHRWLWVDRVAAFDANESYEDMVANQEARREMRLKDAQDARAIKEKVVERMLSLDVSRLSPTQLRDWWETADKIARLSLGEVTSNVQQTIEDKRDDLEDAIAKNPDLMNELADLLEEE